MSFTKGLALCSVLLALWVFLTHDARALEGFTYYKLSSCLTKPETQYATCTACYTSGKDEPCYKWLQGLYGPTVQWEVTAPGSTPSVCRRKPQNSPWAYDLQCTWQRECPFPAVGTGGEGCDCPNAFQEFNDATWSCQCTVGEMNPATGTCDVDPCAGQPGTWNDETGRCEVNCPPPSIQAADGQSCIEPPPECKNWMIHQNGSTICLDTNDCPNWYTNAAGEKVCVDTDAPPPPEDCDNWVTSPSGEVVCYDDPPCPNWYINAKGEKICTDPPEPNTNCPVDTMLKDKNGNCICPNGRTFNGNACVSNSTLDSNNTGLGGSGPGPGNPDGSGAKNPGDTGVTSTEKSPKQCNANSDYNCTECDPETDSECQACPEGAALCTPGKTTDGPPLHCDANKDAKCTACTPGVDASCQACPAGATNCQPGTYDADGDGIPEVWQQPGGQDAVFPDLTDQITFAKEGLRGMFTNIINEARRFADIDESTGGSLPCFPPVEVMGAEINLFCFSDYSDELNIVGLALLASSLVIAVVVIIK